MRGGVAGGRRQLRADYGAILRDVGGCKDGSRVRAGRVPLSGPVERSWSSWMAELALRLSPCGPHECTEKSAEGGDWRQGERLDGQAHADASPRTYWRKRSSLFQ